VVRIKEIDNIIYTCRETLPSLKLLNLHDRIKSSLKQATPKTTPSFPLNNTQTKICKIYFL